MQGILALPLLLATKGTAGARALACSASASRSAGALEVPELGAAMLSGAPDRLGAV